MISATAERQEPGRYYNFESRLPQGYFFELRPNNLPRNAKPITDEASGMCIGYTVLRHLGYGKFMTYRGILCAWRGSA